MQNLKVIVLGTLMMVVVLMSSMEYFGNNQPQGQTVVAEAPEPAVIKDTPEQQDVRLRQFIYDSISQLNKLSFSDTRRELLADNIIYIANKIFHMHYDYKEAFVLIISIESKFDRMAKSTAGAVGLTQVMSKYAKEFAAECGLGDFKQEDLYNETINLYLGACQLKKLLEHEKVQGNVIKAIVAYNAGLHSKQMEEILKGKTVSNQETAGYIQKFANKKEQHRLLNAATPEEKQ